MANQKNPIYKLVKKLEKTYKSFNDFLRYPPTHGDIDPDYSPCNVFLDVTSITDIKKMGNGTKEFLVTSLCPLHLLKLQYRATLRTRYPQKMLATRF